MNAEWRTAAACRSADVEPETFFPAAEDGPVYEAQVAVAKAICAGCSVRTDCLAEALIRIPYGIAGGLTPEERRGRHPAKANPSAAALQAGLRRGARWAEVRDAALVLLTAGRPIAEVATQCHVTPRTVERWRARHRAEGSHGGNRTPLLTSPTPNAQPRTRTQEGHDPR